MTKNTNALRVAMAIAAMGALVLFRLDNNVGFVLGMLLIVAVLVGAFLARRQIFRGGRPSS